jgi:PAS domain S-box-containing protein
MTINAQGIIQMANKVAVQLLGYKKGELEGKNVSCIMPQPFSGRHNGYLRNYITTGALHASCAAPGKKGLPARWCTQQQQAL